MENPLNAIVLIVLAIIAVAAVIFVVYVWFWHIAPTLTKPGVRRQPTPTSMPGGEDVDDSVTTAIKEWIEQRYAKQ